MSRITTTNVSNKMRQFNCAAAIFARITISFQPVASGAGLLTLPPSVPAEVLWGNSIRLFFVKIIQKMGQQSFVSITQANAVKTRMIAGVTPLRSFHQHNDRYGLASLDHIRFCVSDTSVSLRKRQCDCLHSASLPCGLSTSIDTVCFFHLTAFAYVLLYVNERATSGPGRQKNSQVVETAGN
jgi:hypothetical protein